MMKLADVMNVFLRICIQPVMHNIESVAAGADCYFDGIFLQCCSLVRALSVADGKMERLPLGSMARPKSLLGYIYIYISKVIMTYFTCQ